jgi:hypothetical protein
MGLANRVPNSYGIRHIIAQATIIAYRLALTEPIAHMLDD